MDLMSNNLWRVKVGLAEMLKGGVIAVVLDEVMGKVCRFRGVRAVTAEMNIEYLKPVWVDADLVVEGYEKEMTGRSLHLVGEIKDASGNVLARSRGRFVILGTAQKKQDGAAEQVSST